MERALAQLRAIPGVASVTERSVALGGTSTLVIAYAGPPEQLRDAIAALGGWNAAYAGGMIEAARTKVAAPPAEAPPPR